jgi:hypothetical protein
MNLLVYFGVFGGGFVLGLLLLIAACFTSRRAMRILCVVALVIVGLQSLFWIWAAGFASIADHGSHHTPVGLWSAAAGGAFAIAALWSWMLFRFRHDHTA